MPPATLRAQVRPKWLQIEFDELAETLEWLEKDDNRMIIICSVPSQVS